MHKLTADRVRAIRAAHDKGAATIQDLADEHGVSRQCIWMILSRRTWSHLA